MRIWTKKQGAKGSKKGFAFAKPGKVSFDHGNMSRAASVLRLVLLEEVKTRRQLFELK